MKATLKIINGKYWLWIYNENGELVYKYTSYLFSEVSDIAWDMAKIDLEYIEIP